MQFKLCRILLEIIYGFEIIKIILVFFSNRVASVIKGIERMETWLEIKISCTPKGVLAYALRSD